MHAPPAHFLALATLLSTNLFIIKPVLVLDLAALGVLGSARLGQVLNNRAVDGELVPASAGLFLSVFGGCGLRDEGLQDFLDDAVVPRRCLVVSVACGRRESGGASVGSDLREAGGGDGLFEFS